MCIFLPRRGGGEHREPDYPRFSPQSGLYTQVDKKHGAPGDILIQRWKGSTCLHMCNVKLWILTCERMKMYFVMNAPLLLDYVYLIFHWENKALKHSYAAPVVSHIDRWWTKMSHHILLMIDHKQLWSIVMCVFHTTCDDCGWSVTPEGAQRWMRWFAID